MIPRYLQNRVSFGLGRKILQRMADLGIKTNVELVKRMDVDVHPNTVGKWISGRTTPRGDNLVALAKALNISVDLLVLDEGENPEQTKSLERMVSAIVKAEVQRVSNIAKNGVDSILSKFIESEKIPQEDKDSILRQIGNLLRLYDEKS